METMRELQEISALTATAMSVEERRHLHDLLRATETEIDSSDDLIAE